MLEDTLKVSMNEYLPLRDVVFNTLRQAILTGELKPGERLMEIGLAQRLGVSRTPIREAIRKLELEGLVIMVPRKGAEVADITEKDLKDVLEVRTALESLAIELCLANMKQEDIEALKEANANFVEYAGANNLVKMAAADEAFHELIYNYTDNKRLIQIVNNLREQMYRYRLEYIKDEACHARLIGEHEALIEALSAGNLESAKDIIAKHVENQERSILKIIKEKSEHHSE